MSAETQVGWKSQQLYINSWSASCIWNCCGNVVGYQNVTAAKALIWCHEQINYLTWEKVMWDRWTLKGKLKEEQIPVLHSTIEIWAGDKNVTKGKCWVDMSASKTSIKLNMRQLVLNIHDFEWPFICNVYQFNWSTEHLLISNLRAMGKEEQHKEMLIKITQHSNPQCISHKPLWDSESQAQPWHNRSPVIPTRYVIAAKWRAKPLTLWYSQNVAARLKQELKNVWTFQAQIYQLVQLLLEFMQ